MASGTYWLTAAPMAAALRCLGILEADGSAVMHQMQRSGQRLVDGLRAEAAARDLAVTVSGERACWKPPLGTGAGSYKRMKDCDMVPPVVSDCTVLTRVCVHP